ncbi:hypothetical protein RclHR1_26380004 [Rhizophagus clarus]|nr:hypothetical protein RclHR1_26380004 [Rhizophagus clarus]
MEYADSGTLRNYLSERFEILTWNDKLNLAFQLANAISCLHDKDIVHRDLHSNNILVRKNIIKLADFGLSKRIEELFNYQSKLSFAYVDPQIFNNDNQMQVYSLNKKSDIYSIGVLLWEISSGRPPLCNESYDVNLSLKILQGLREMPIPNTPEDYVKIYTDCWNNEPDNRPTINQVVTKLKSIISYLKQNDSNEDIQLSNEQSLNEPLNEKISQIIHNFNKININEIEPSTSTNLIINDLEMVINELIFLLEGIRTERKKHEIINYLNNKDITSKEIYDWLLLNQDNSNSIYLLGIFNHFGIEINVDYQKAFKLYQNSMYLGNIFGIVSLGYCYQNGIGTSIDVQKAFELYQKAANLGNSRGIYNLGYCYNKGVGTNIDNQKAFELYQTSANLGYAHGMNNLGYCFDNGIGTIVDKQKAFEFYQKSANLGNSLAQYNLAIMYENGEVIKNIDQAIYWYKKSAEQGDQDAQFNLDILLINQKD